MKKIEIIGKRKPNEKHFLQDDGTFVAEMYENNIHFFQDGHYEEIDNTLIKMNDFYVNKNNSWKVLAPVNYSPRFMRIEKDEKYIDFYLKNNNNYSVSVENSENKLSSKIIFNNVFNYIDIQYLLDGSKIKENIIINSKDFDKADLCFYIKTNLDLFMEENHDIFIKDGTNNIFMIDNPFIIDTENNICNNCKYEISKDNSCYLLKLIIDEKWCKENNNYPLIVDPTITELTNENSLIDTYIYPNDTNVTRGNLDYLKVGIERQNENDIVNRALLKFDLPTLGTGSQVINATLILNNYPYSTSQIFYENIDIHRITTDWTEFGANWNNMNNNYDARVDGAFIFTGIYYIDPQTQNPIILNETADITNLVQKWYTGTPNYGILLKLSREIYQNHLIPLFFSREFQNNSGDSPKPILSITYRNQNGLENYMNYEMHKLHYGTLYHNVYNGNLTHVLDLVSTKAGKMPVNLQLIYNTNDVVLNNDIGYGIGYRLNLSQMIKEVTIDNKVYLEYADQDGTLHYFLNERRELVNGVMQTVTYENKYFDEDNLNLVIDKETTKYIMTDKNNNIKEFNIISNIGYLTKMQDVSGNTNIITYDNDNRIVNIKDANNQNINVRYSHNPSLVINVEDDNRHGVRLQYVSNSLMEVDFYKKALIDYMIYYCENHLIKSIIDVTGKKIEYQYYENIPYKVKKVTEYGENDSVGNYYDVRYGFNETSLIDRNNRIKSIVFNSQGNSKSIAFLKDDNSLVDALGKQGSYVDAVYNKKNLNKKMEEHPLIQSVINLLKNSSFEDSEIIFIPDSNTSISISNDYYHYGLQSLKIQPNGNSNEYKIEKIIGVEKGAYYTFSGFTKTLNDNTSIKLSIKYVDDNLVEHEEYSALSTENEFERLDTTIFIPNNISNSNITISIIINGNSICYLDDIQLEKSQVANEYNLIDNADFKNGYNDWTITSSLDPVADVFDSIVENGQSMLKVEMNTSNSTTFSKEFNIRGLMHDQLSLSFWFKNEGLCGGSDEMGSIINNNVTIIYYPSDPNTPGGDKVESFQLNPCEGEWQFFSYDFSSPFDFNKVKLIFTQSLNANDFYITNINLFKNIPNIKYKYDEAGNLIQTKKMNDEYINYKYSKDNEIISFINQKNSKLYYEYDNLITNRITRGSADNGLTNILEYDEAGNPILYRIINTGEVINIYPGCFSIRLRGTNKYCRLLNNKISLINENHNHNKWNFEVVTINDIDYYKISHSLINDKYFTVTNSGLILAEYDSNSSLFELIKQDDCSFYIKNLSTGKYIKNVNDILIASELDSSDKNFNFVFENSINNNFIENTVKYDVNKKYIVENESSDLYKNKYSVDEEGIVKEIIDSKGNKVTYSHDNYNRITSVNSENAIVNYQYYKKTLSKIEQGNRVYNFVYDDFMNIKSLKIGDNITLYINNYDSYNGKLISTYFSTGVTNSYEYDEFDRLIKVLKSDDTYNYIYDNKGNIAKILSTDILNKFVYDYAMRLSKYVFNNFKILYMYDNNENVINKKYEIDNMTFNYNNILDINDRFIRTEVDNQQILYTYDNLDRLVETSVDNIINTIYEYIKNGKRETMLVKSININGNKLYYKYDKLGKITHIYNNNILEKHYYYDSDGQIIRDDNYLNNITTRYFYDKYNNLIYVKKYKINTYDLISTIKYKYNNPNWIDQLTSFNDIPITYDSIGNPITIGNNISITWVNGKNMNSYTNGNNVVQFKYDVNNLRYKKIRNNVETNYYYDNKELVLEKTGNNVIYYIRNNNGDLVGFNYNGSIYYYVKNLQNDIMMILNSSSEVVAKYQYDSWGNIESITDGNNNNVSNNLSHIANINPYRYRSYYYDVETNLYYLKSRYYNPQWGRYLTIDEYINSNEDIISNNVYIYCSNDPINNIDPSGKLIIKILSDIVKSVNKIYNSVKQTIKKLTTKSKSSTSSTLPHTMVAAPSKPLPDYSSDLDRVLKTNTAKATAVSSITSYIGTLGYFYLKENPGAKWDYKIDKRWESDINGTFPYSYDKNREGHFDNFLYHGKITTAEDFGNIHYGYVGTAMGIPSTVLFIGGGYAHCKITPEIFQPPYYCDDVNDHEAIQRGIDMYYGSSN